MPTILVAETKNGRRRLLNLVFPQRIDSLEPERTRWDWPELRVCTSTIHGFGLFPQSTTELDWEKLNRPVALPYIGMETVAESRTQACLLRSVLCGNFDIVLRRDLRASRGQMWVRDGLYVTSISRAEFAKHDPPPTVVEDPDETLIQVVVEPDFDMVNPTRHASSNHR